MYKRQAQANGLPCVISDQITGEAVLSRENVTMISLAESPEKWAKAVFKMKEAGRIEREEAARKMCIRDSACYSLTGKPCFVTLSDNEKIVNNFSQ